MSYFFVVDMSDGSTASEAKNSKILSQNLQSIPARKLGIKSPISFLNHEKSAQVFQGISDNKNMRDSDMKQALILIGVIAVICYLGNLFGV